MRLFAFLALFLAALPVYSQESSKMPAPPAGGTVTVTESTKTNPDGSVTKQTKTESSDGATDVLENLGLGIAVFGLQDEEIVKATIENNILRVTEKRKMRAGPWLQTQWVHDTWPTDWIKLGFFVGAEVLGGDQLIRSVGIGPVLQFRRNQGDKRKHLNVGVGIAWTNVQVLGGGLSKNAAVPSGVEAVRFETKTQPGVVINVSFGL